MLSLRSASASEISQALALRAQERRLDANLTQEGLSKRAGVTLASLKRFEQTGQISLEGLIRLAIALDCADSIEEMFKPREFETLQDVLAQDLGTKRRRGRIK